MVEEATRNLEMRRKYLTQVSQKHKEGRAWRTAYSRGRNRLHQQYTLRGVRRRTKQRLN